jgi:hypothetical protein
VVLAAALTVTTWGCSTAHRPAVERRSTFRPAITAPLAIDVQGDGTAYPPSPDRHQYQVATRGCDRYRVLATWHLVSTAGEPFTAPEVTAALTASQNRLARIEWSDRGSSLRTLLRPLRVGQTVRIRSPWFERVTDDAASIELWMRVSAFRTPVAFHDRWVVDRLGIECERAAR